MTIIKIQVLEGEGKGRLDSFLASKIIHITRSQIQKLIINSKVFLGENGEFKPITDCSYKIKDLQEFNVENIEIVTEHIIPKEMDIDILFEDEYLVVINKPAGLVVHPGAGNSDNTLVNGLMFKYKDKLSLLNGQIRAGIVHRLDKDTSGVLVVAKDAYTHGLLAKQFEVHSIVRNYRALVWGRPLKNKGTIETFIRRSDTNRQKMMVSDFKGKKAITNYKLLNSYDDALSLVELNLKTGRTHQIRVHMAHLGHSVVGDPVYSKLNNKFIKKLDKDIKELITNLHRQSLHAYKLGFIHPITEEYMAFEKEEPEELLTIYSRLFV